MSKKLVMWVVAVLAFACMGWAAEKGKSFTGVVSDDHCQAKHSAASDAAAECVKKCVSMGGKYALASKGKVYKLDPQDKFADFAGKRVKVMGTLSGDTITASEVTEAPAAAKKASKKAGM